MRRCVTTSTWWTGLVPPAIAFLTILSSCGTTPTTPDQLVAVPPPKADSPRAGLFVPCSSIAPVIFHAPKKDEDVSESAANVFDTPETINAVRKQNAAIREACDK